MSKVSFSFWVCDRCMKFVKLNIRICPFCRNSVVLNSIKRLRHYCVMICAIKPLDGWYDSTNKKRAIRILRLLEKI